MLEKRGNPAFPGMSSFDKHLGKRSDMLEAVRSYATERPEYRDLLKVLPASADSESEQANEAKFEGAASAPTGDRNRAP